jgi:zinc protease
VSIFSRTTVFVLAACFLLHALSARACAASLQYPPASRAQTDGVRMVTENDPDAVLTGAQVFIAAGLQQQPPNQSGIAALLAEMIVRTGNVRDAIADLGGVLTYTVEGRSVHYYLETRSEQFPALTGLFSRALGKPDFSAGNVAAARKALIARIGENQSNPLVVGIEMFKSSYYLNGAGASVMGSAASLERITGKDAAAFYTRTYKRGALDVSVVGGVTPDVRASLTALALVLAGGDREPLAHQVRELGASNGTRIVAQRDVGAPFLVVGFPAPAPANKDFAAMMVLEALLGQSFDRSATSTQTLAERTVSAFYLYDSEPASFVVFVNGARVEPTLTLRELLLVVQSLAEKPIQNEALDHFKAAATGALLSDTLTLADRSYLIGTLQQQGLDPDALNFVLAALQKTTPADVQRVAKVYLQKYIVAIVLPREY